MLGICRRILHIIKIYNIAYAIYGQTFSEILNPDCCKSRYIWCEITKKKKKNVYERFGISLTARCMAEKINIIYGGQKLK